MCPSVYEAHLKQILKDQGKMDGGQSEATVQDLVSIPDFVTRLAS